MIKPFNINPDIFRKVVLTSSSIKESLQKLGFPSSQGNYYRRFHKTCADLGVSTDHFKRDYSYLRKEMPLESILVKGSHYVHSHPLKLRLIKENLLEYRCAGTDCIVVDSWLNSPISLQLDHINGIRNDNRLENLRLLCPNCHSQTPTYAGKRNRYRDLHCLQCKCSISYGSKGLCRKCANRVTNSRNQKMSIDKESLRNLLKSSESIVSIAKSLRLSDNGIRRWCKKWKLKPSHPNRGSDLK